MLEERQFIYPNEKSELMTSSRTNILFVVAALSIGGAERQLVELLKGIDRNHFDPSIAFLDLSAGFTEEVERLNIPSFYPLRKWRWDPLVIFKLVYLIRKHRISLLHTYLSMAGIYGSLAARIAGIPMVNSAIRATRYPTPYERIFLKPSFALSSVVIANSEAGQKVFNGLAPHKIRVVHNGVDLTRFNELADLTQKKKDLNLHRFNHIVSLVGRLGPEKNPMMFLRMAAIVLKHEQNTAFVAVGTGSLKEQLESEIRKTGLGANVFLLGSRTDVEEILQITDVGILTSDMEGLPNTVIEMLASGVPVVATNCGGTMEILDVGKTGFCVERNDAQTMAQQVLKLLRDDTLRKTMGATGKQVVRERFSLDRMTDATESIYWELLRLKPLRAVRA